MEELLVGAADDVFINKNLCWTKVEFDLKGSFEEIDVLELSGFVSAVFENEDLDDVFVVNDYVSSACTTCNRCRIVV